MAIVSSCMEDARDYDQSSFLNDFVYDSIWESGSIAPANVSLRMLAAVEKRIVRQRVKHLNCFFAKFRSQSLPFGVIPGFDFLNVVLDLRAKQNSPL
jgi:hypothetical protein